jgi:hypothetical protein
MLPRVGSITTTVGTMRRWWRRTATIVAVMTVRGARIKERGVNCAVVIVPGAVITDEVEADRIITAFQNQVHQGAVVLMAQDFQGSPTFYGRAEIVRFLERTDVTKIRWIEYAITDDSN